jgi:hypothetical protein
MPISESTSKSFTDLGIAGAALLIVLVLVILVFAFMRNQSKSIDKLCVRIDNLVTQNSTYLITNEKDQKEILRMLVQIAATETDIQMRVVKIDERTVYNQLIEQNKRVKEEITVE